MDAQPFTPRERSFISPAQIVAIGLVRRKSSVLGQTRQRRSRRPPAVRVMASAGSWSTAWQAVQARALSVSTPAWVTVAWQAGQA